MANNACPQCGRPFGKRRRCYFCNGRPKSGENRACANCGNPFYVPRWQIDMYPGGGTYCSRACTNAGITGRKFRLRKNETTRYITDAGYVLVKVGIHEWEFEHRLVVEKHIGRELGRDETVHHINGIKTDNRLRNLEVVSRSEHMRMHGKVGGKVRHRRSKS